MGIKDQAKARLAPLLPAGVEPTYLWKTPMPFLGERQTVCLFGFEGREGFTLGLVAERGADPWLLPAPDWDSRRKGKREREIDALQLYLGHTIYQKREAGPPSKQLLDFAQRKLGAALQHSQATEAELVEVINVKGFGGIHTVVSRTMTTGRVEYVSKNGRIISPSAGVLDAVAAHPMWAFLALDNLPQRRWGTIGWG